VTRHSNTNIFSGLNNLTDISSSSQYGTLVGFTQDEINQYFSTFIENAAKNLNTSIDNIKNELKDNYDGFCFSTKLDSHVYNPWSVIRFFSASADGFISYWIDSGFSSFVVKYFTSKSKEKNNLDIFRILNAPIKLSENDIKSNVPIIEAKPESILYQSGFLTLNQKDVFGFKATVPNFEVRKALSSQFFDMINDSKEVFVDNLDGSFKALIQEGLSTLNIKKILEGFQCILNNFRPVTNIFSKEIYICDAISGFIHFLDAIVKREDPMLLGDSDLIIYYKNTRYLFEFKIAKDESEAPKKLNEAINQILEKKYGKNSETTKLYRFGVVFNLEKRVFSLGKLIEE
ncbi:MAG: AAA family ATPase, partial [Succinivibrionaceae bacterium]|nr:AAA family ATPase [Succinivibrionaceae bacterium]